MFAYIFIAIVLPAITLAYPVTPCGPGVPAPIEIRVAECDASPCHINRGAVISFQHDFLANENSTSLTMEVDIIAFGETSVFPVPAILANVCNWLVQGACPTQPGAMLTHSSAIPIITEHHGGIPVTFRARIYNASRNYTVCTIVQAVIH